MLKLAFHGTLEGPRQSVKGVQASLLERTSTQ